MTTLHPFAQAQLRVLDLFSGIGGFSLGLERTNGFQTVAFCEIEPFCQKVLAKHWPGVPIYDDIRTLTADTLARDGIGVDVICGGFPCQDVSFAGKRAGLEGERSGLWGEYSRLIGELRPRFVIVENVPGLLNLGMGTVLGDLAEIGYDAVWDCIPASAVGAPHRRDRVWLVAYAGGELHEGRCFEKRRTTASKLHAAKSATMQRSQIVWHEPDGNVPRDGEVAHTESNGRQPRRAGDAAKGQRGRQSSGGGFCSNIRNPNVSGLAFRQGQSRDVGQEQPAAVGADWWSAEPAVGRVAHGVRSRVDRLRALGNAVVPQIPELIGRAILASMAEQNVLEAAE